MRGQFIVIYGMNNLGKTTAATSLVEQLNARGTTAQYLKYPVYGIESGQRLNVYLRQGNPEGLTVEQAQELFAQNRRDYQNQLEQLLEDGVTMVAEDYIGTAIAWGQIFGVSVDRVEDYNRGLLQPDIAVLLDGQRFTTGREENHKHEDMSEEQWRSGRKIHLDLAQRYGWQIVNANQTRDKVLSDLLDIILPALSPEGNRRRVEVE